MGDCHTVCRVGELADGKGLGVRVGEKLIAVFNVGGKYFAIDDVCPHMGASLCEGDVAEGIVTCPWHGWRFCLADGTWADSPRVKIGSYGVEVVGDEVQVRVVNATKS